jgi:hypothetical protein
MWKSLILPVSTVDTDSIGIKLHSGPRALDGACALPFQAIFGSEAIPLWVWPWLLGGGLVFFFVVETEKLIIRLSGSLRSTITAVEAGT